MNQAEVKRRQAEALSEILTWITILVIGHMTGNNGVTYLIVAFEAVAPVWILAGGGLTDGLGRLLRGRNNKGQYKNAAKLRSCALYFQLVLGALGSLALLFASEGIADKIFKVRYSALILMVLSPVVLLRTVTSVLLGYFQGEGTEFPTAVTGILRQIFILGFGLLFAGILKGYGSRVSGLLMQYNFTAMYASVGIAIAVSVSEVFVILFLFILYKGSRRRGRKAKQESAMRTVDSFADCVRFLCGKRWKELVLGLLAYLPFALGWLFFEKAVKEEDIASAEYGMYAGRYLAVCGIAIAAIAIVTLPLIGKTLSAFKKDEQRLAKVIFQSGLHINALHGIYAAFFAAVMAGQLSMLLNSIDDQAVMKMLRGGSAFIVFMALSGYFARLLLAMDRKYPVMAAMAAADVLFVISIAVLLNAGKAGVLALVYGGLIGSGVLCILLGVFACGQLRLKIDWLRILLQPLLAGGLAGIICMLLEKAFAPHLGSLVTLVVALVLSEAFYWAVLMLTRNFREQELDYIPGGRLLNALGQMLHVF